MNSMYSDYERKLIAEKEYDNTLQVDNDIYIETRKKFHRHSPSGDRRRDRIEGLRS